MLRPDRLGLVGCLLIFALSFVFHDSDNSEDTHRRPKDGNLADLKLATP